MHVSQYEANWLSNIANPFSVARNSIYLAVRELSPKLRGSVLDIGCGKAPYSRAFFHDRWAGLEIDTPENRRAGVASFFYLGDVFPIPDRSFNSVLATQVLEHVFNPEQFLREINRVLVSGGTLLITVPFIWQEHEKPNDFARYTSFGLEHLLTTNGFKIIDQRKLTVGFEALGQLIIADKFERISSRGHMRKGFFIFVESVLIKLGCWLFAKVSASHSNIYLDNLVLATKVNDSRIESNPVRS